MLHTHFADLQARIRRSMLLSPEQSARLLDILPRLSEAEMEQLSDLLHREDGAMTDLTKAVIERAVADDDAAFLRSLDDVLHSQGRLIREKEESAERTDEVTTAERLFDQS